MPSGQVTVDSKSLLSGLEAEGKVAIYGIYFDTGKAEIKPESQAQLEEMGKLMKSQPGLKVFIVGHTDNQGQFDFNVTLSRQRAQAVVDALTKNFGIAVARMIPYGVASVAPVASNAEEAGRAKNRRVELVKQ
jgi:OmpA-OmpF porin, OOP family